MDARTIRISRYVAVGWLLFVLSTGTYVIASVFAVNHSLGEAIFPIYLAVWLAIFFAGRSALARCVSKMLASSIAVSDFVVTNRIGTTVVAQKTFADDPRGQRESAPVYTWLQR